MDQPRDDNKGQVNLNVHTTTEGDRHPITQYNVWSRPSVEYHLPTKSKSRIVVMEWRYCQTRSSRVICDSTTVQQKAQSYFDSSSTSNETSCRNDFCQPLRLQHGPDSKTSELVRPRAKPRTSIATRTFSFNLAGVQPRACMNAGHSHTTVEYACVL